MGRRVTEICKNAVTQISGDQASAGLYNCRRLTKIAGKNVIKIFRIEALGEGHRAHEIAKHHAKLPAFGSGARLS
jgi:hypothetical protein